ncbi:unnamed protein product [Moneuplotes crassus]|uniref:RNA-dependent RNA polymerase n=1 Tax=Euplotes crassus TaxID=5936 RepID=A0AAD1XH96_EUPCR|nr:unnamed protein product [Moneuplotes crassus]
MEKVRKVEFGLEKHITSKKSNKKIRAKLFVPVFRSLEIPGDTEMSGYGTLCANYDLGDHGERSLTGIRVEEKKRYEEIEEGKLCEKRYYEFGKESVKEVTCVYQGHAFFEVHMKLSKLPERFLWSNTNGTHKIKSELWTDSVLMSSIQSQFCVRIRGYHTEVVDPLFKRKKNDGRTENYMLLDFLQKEFKNRYKKKGPSYVKNIYYIEDLMVRNMHNGVKKLEKMLSKLPFAVNYSFMCLLSTKRIHFLDYSLDHYCETIDWLQEVCESSEDENVYKELEHSMRKITFAYHQKSCFKKNLLEMIQSNYERIHANKILRIFDLPIHKNRLVKIRIVSITPSRIELNFGTITMPNRAIRDNYNHIDNFIRVRFLNEDGQRGIYWDGAQNDGILDHIRKVMKNGFTIGDKLFKFLHFSNSQIKSHSCWFMNEVPGELEYSTFIKSLGNFSKEKSIFKGIARRGQAFSSSVATAKLEISNQIIEVPDIERNGYTFSDGCGEIDKEFFEEKILKKHFKHSMCSAIQIRMGGYKGVLLATNNLAGNCKVLTKKSMNKFELPESQTEVNLEVIRLATYMNGYLNKQIILVMWSNGIDENVFIKIQQNYISELLSYYHLKNLDIDSRYPAELFQSFCVIQRKIEGMHKQGDDYYKDPFIKPIIKSICFNRLRDVCKKFRIFDKFSCNLIGVIDPYNCLEENEVFIQINKSTKYCRERNAEDTTLVSGKVLVTRSPCVHPGDLRILTAVDEPMLHDMVNVIVFSAKGDRPDQHKMGSGDLDGDIYWINWRPDFVYNYIEKEPDTKNPELLELILEEKAMTVASKYTLNKTINREKCILAFIDYLRKDILGQVAFLHLKAGDKRRDNLKKKDCLILAKMHCIAVDSAKSDHQIKVEVFKVIQNKYPRFVDFLYFDSKPGKNKKVFKSPGILGILHRKIKVDIDNEELYLLEYQTKILKDYQIDHQLLQNDAICKHLSFIYQKVVIPFNSFIRNILLENNLVSEGDLFNSTCEFSSLTFRRDDAIQIRQSLSMLFDKVKEEFNQVIKDYQLDNFVTIGVEETKLQHIEQFEMLPELSCTLKFLAYFNHKHYSQVKLLFNNENFDEFWELYLQETDIETDPINYSSYKRIAKSTYNEEDELSSVLSQSQIFSSWWLLTS